MLAESYALEEPFVVLENNVFAHFEPDPLFAPGRQTGNDLPMW